MVTLMTSIWQSLDKYRAACKIAKRYAAEHAGDGFSGLLPALDDVMPSCSELASVSLGLVDAPMSKIRGTATAGRASAFAGNYMPLLPDSSEFANKWIMLYEAHMESGIRDPGTAYEYLGYYYIIEGNKRVSVLRSLDAPSVHLEVTRLIPRESDAERDKDARLYLEWLNAAPRRKVVYIWLTTPGAHTELYSLMRSAERPGCHENWMYEAYGDFRAQYHKFGLGKLPITTGDAFLTYVKLFGFPYREEKDSLIKKLKSLDRQLMYQAYGARAQTRAIRPKTPRAVFVYDNSPLTDEWDAAHDYGRRALSDAFPEAEIETFTDLNAAGDADGVLKELCARVGEAVVFITGAGRRGEAQRMLLTQAQPQTLVCHCHPEGDGLITPTYYGRTAEPAFILGALAGSMTDAPALVYRPGSLAAADIAAFALGAGMVNGRARVTRRSSIDGCPDGVALLAGRGDMAPYTAFPGVIARLVSIRAGRAAGRLAASAWDFGAFYRALCASLWDADESEGIIKGIGAVPVHFESGLDSGLLSVHLNYAELPPTALLLAETITESVKRDGIPDTGKYDVRIDGAEEL